MKIEKDDFIKAYMKIAEKKLRSGLPECGSETCMLKKSYDILEDYGRRVWFESYCITRRLKQ